MAEATCVCGNNFFIEHENASVVSGTDVHEVLSSSSLIGYKLIECVFCRKLFVARQKKKGQMEEVIPIERFSAEHVDAFKTRNDARGRERFDGDVLRQMIMKR